MFEQIPLQNNQEQKALESKEENDTRKNQENNQEQEERQEKEKNIENEQELEEFLDKEVFTKLGLTEEDEKQELERIRKEIKKNPEKTPPIMEEITKRSFDNTKKYLRILFTDFSLKGVTDYNTFFNKIRPQFYNEEAEKMGCFKKKSPNDPYPKLHYRIPAGTREAEIFHQRLSERLKKECPRVKSNPEEILDFISRELQKKSKNATVTINTYPSVLEFWLKHGRAISTSDVAENKELENELNNWINTHYGSSLYSSSPSQEHLTNPAYVEKRKNFERRLKFNDRYPIYGALATNEEELKKGAAPAYGDIVIFLNTDGIKDRTSFTSRDSYDFQEVSNFTYKHALIVKAIHDFTREHSKYVDPSKGEGFMSNQPDSFHLFDTSISDYIEAQIIGGLDIKDIKEIKIRFPQEATEEITNSTNEFAQKLKTEYPQFADKIKLEK